MKPRMALFQHHPECSIDCCDGMRHALSDGYDIELFDETQLTSEFLKDFDIVAFPGGIGDSESFHGFFRRRTANAVADFVSRGGKYLGICMGAYWAGPWYFDILDGVDAVQYIKRKDADVRRSFSSTARVDWQGHREQMFFYDGCSLLGDESRFETVARYANGDPMAIIQGNIGVIGCHPEAMPYWFDKPYLCKHWHDYRHHQLLREFVDRLVQG